MARHLARFLGHSGQRVVAAEILKRGYNVAVPEVDTGDDLLVLDDESGRYWPVQVKTVTGVPLIWEPGYRARFRIPGRQLRRRRRVELCYVLAVRLPDVSAEESRRGVRSVVRWEFLILSRRALLREHRRGLGSLREKELSFAVVFRAGSVRGGGVDLQRYRNNWGRYWAG